MSLSCYDSDGILLTHYTEHMTGDLRITMCYVLFNSRIRNKHRIKIVGWPEYVPFQRPGAHERPVLERILHGWRSGKIHFVRISAAELRDIRQKEKASLVARTVRSVVPTRA